jgi:hypothetical protein
MEAVGRNPYGKMNYMYGYIYETTNLINGKKYIGKHVSKDFDEKYKGSGKALKRAIKKYGFENFNCKILKECYSEEELNDSEIFYIQACGADTSNDYYNISSGGENSIKGLVNMYNPETDKVIVSHRCNIEENMKNGFVFGMRPHSEESKRKSSESMKKLIYMTDGTKTVHIDKKLKEHYENLGFHVGRDKPARPNQKEENRKWVNKDGKSFMIKGEDLEDYIKNGYSLGRAKFSHFNRTAPAWNKGIPATEESKEKNRLAHLGKKRKVS